MFNYLSFEIPSLILSSELLVSTEGVVRTENEETDIQVVVVR